MWHILAFGFCVLWLIIQAGASNYFRDEVITLLLGIIRYSKNTLVLICSWTESAAGLADGISNDTASSIIYWIILITVGIILVLFFLGLPLLLTLGGSFLYLSSDKFDKLNRWIMVGSGIFLIVMASELFYKPPINLILLWLLLQIAAPLLRYLFIPLICNGIGKYQSMDYFEQEQFRGTILIAVIVIIFAGLLIWWIPWVLKQ